MPKLQPKQYKIVVLEASSMLIYNFYGSYKNLFVAYDKMKRYCDKHDLLQSGPMREFYITDPEKEKDQEKWLTRVMLPVVSMHKK
jgi:effector-binding domain-containing protein